MPDIFDTLVDDRQPDIFDQVSADSGESAAFQAADEQQAMEREAGKTITGADVSQTIQRMANFPGKVALAAGGIFHPGGPKLYWPTDEEAEAPLLDPDVTRGALAVSSGGITEASRALQRRFPKNPVAQVAGGITEGVTGAVQSFSTPSNIALIPALPSGGAIGKLIAGVFLGQAIQGTPEQWQQLKEAPNLSDKVKIATQMGLGYALPAAAFLHSKGTDVSPKPSKPVRLSPAEYDALMQEWGLRPKESVRPSIEVEPKISAQEAVRYAERQEVPISSRQSGSSGTPDVPLPLEETPFREAARPLSNAASRSEGLERQVSDPSRDPNILGEPEQAPSVPKPKQDVFDQVSGEKEAVTESVQTQGQNAPFVPSTEWQEVPPGTVLPNGGEYRMDQATGKSYARWPETTPSEAAGTSRPSDKQSVEPLDQPPLQQTPDRPASLAPEASDNFRESRPQSQPEITPTSTKNAITNAERVSDDPFISRIANRFTEERVKTGEIGEIAPGQGYATRDLVERGLRMPPEEINQHVSDLMWDSGNDPVKQAAAVRAEEARLSDRATQLSKAAEANPADIRAQQAADAAFRDLTDFHNGPIAKLKTRFHATGIALQGEIPVDLSTFNGLREAWLKENGRTAPPKMEPVFKRVAGNVRRAVAEENTITTRLGLEIEKATKGRKLPSAEEVRNAIVERMKEPPCRV